MSKFKICKRGGHGIDVKIRVANLDTDTVLWDRGNSYVLVAHESPVPARFWTFWTEAGEPVQIVSVNGIGECRWSWSRSNVESALRAERDGTLQEHWDEAAALRLFRKFRLSLTCPPRPLGPEEPLVRTALETHWAGDTDLKTFRGVLAAIAEDHGLSVAEIGRRYGFDPERP